METEIKTITLLEKACIFTNWFVTICGLIFIYGCFHIAWFGIPPILRNVELAQIHVELEGTQVMTESVQDKTDSQAIRLRKLEADLEKLKKSGNGG